MSSRVSRRAHRDLVDHLAIRVLNRQVALDAMIVSGHREPAEIVASATLDLRDVEIALMLHA